MGTYDIGPIICTHSLRCTGRVLNSGETASFHGADQGESGEAGVGGRPTASPQPKSKGAGWLNLGGGNACRGFSCTPGPVLRSEMTLDGFLLGLSLLGCVSWKTTHPEWAFTGQSLKGGYLNEIGSGEAA